MRALFLSMVLLVGSLCYSQVTRLDQVKPLKKDAGRVIKLAKVMRIGDEQGGFYFRSPMHLRQGADGSIYVMDFNQLLKFDHKGRFVGNLCKLGQGPGEIGYLNNYLLYHESIIVFGNMPKKIAWFDGNANLLKEFKVTPSMLLADLLLFREAKYYFVYSAEMPVKAEPNFYDVEQIVAEFTCDGNKLIQLGSFPVKKYVMAIGEGGWKSYSIGEFKAEGYQERYLVISHTPEYLLKIFDLKEGNVTHVFSRRYNRVKYGGGRWGKDKNAPQLKYEADIKSLFAQKRGIWVVTSTKDDKKGALIDVFDYTGVYLDTFYLKTTGDILSIQADTVFIRQTADDYNHFIVKYRMKD